MYFKAFFVVFVVARLHINAVFQFLSTSTPKITSCQCQSHCHHPKPVKTCRCLRPSTSAYVCVKPSTQSYMPTRAGGRKLLPALPAGIDISLGISNFFFLLKSHSLDVSMLTDYLRCFFLLFNEDFLSYLIMYAFSHLLLCFHFLHETWFNLSFSRHFTSFFSFHT
ncbi:unnamed protein product [Acanthosepion pharaonis]|uniref:Secreted protein n=1 Tax=Acanthosepion pharaonis TaxID=158019 RepID=A0A812D3J2_ACAPH|nr:unnamed protein product [Sepia pharaonis]